MKFVSRFLLLLPVLLLLAWSCAKEVAIPVTIDFLAAPANATYTSVPVSISVANRTSGAEVYHWTFEGGIPATSEAKNPPLIVYQQAGTYKITLQASNSDGRVDTKTQTIQIDASLTADFGMTTIDNAYPPLTLVLANKSVGGTTFAWTFDGGKPATSTDKDPKVIFEQPGTHTISLKVSNGRVTRQKDTTITVAPDLVPDFTYVPDNAELEAPLVVAVTNATTSATSYTWASGGTLSSPGAKEPTITFAKAGTYTISLTASNGKKTKTVDKTITVKPSTGIYTATDVVLGINTAQSTIGSFYSTSLHKTFKSTDILTPAIGAAIDVVFFGLDATFGFNKFVSPTEADKYTFDAIPGAKQTTWMSTQTLLTSDGFDAINEDSFFRNLPGASIIDDPLYFSGDVVPRVLLFRTADGRKGAVKIKQVIKKGAQDSAIQVDIKVQKTP